MAKFTKGQSGNPGGRPKELKDFKKWLASNRGKRQEKLAALMDSEDEKVQLEAIKHADAYDYGKPTQAVEHSGPALEGAVLFNFKPREG